MELTHANWVYLAEAVEEIGVDPPDHLQFLWLPLSHVFGKLLLAAQYRIGFATAVDGRIDKIVDNLAVIRPTLHGGCPADLREGARPGDVDGAGRGRR